MRAACPFADRPPVPLRLNGDAVVDGVRIQCTYRLGTMRRARYEQMHFLVPKKLAEEARLDIKAPVYLSNLGRRRFTLRRSRRYADDHRVTPTEFVTKRTDTNVYTSYKILIPHELVVDMRLKKGGDVSVTPHSDGLLIAFE